MGEWKADGNIVRGDGVVFNVLPISEGDPIAMAAEVVRKLNNYERIVADLKAGAEIGGIMGAKARRELQRLGEAV